MLALTRKFLKAMGIEEEKIEQIIEAHTETTTALKEERDDYKKDAEKLADVQKELDKAKKAANVDGEETVLKSEYESLKNEYDQYKVQISAEKMRTAKETAYRELLKAAGVSEKRISSILKVTDLDGVELDKDGSIKDAKDRADKIKTEWADFIETKTTRGAETAAPPANMGGGKLTKEDIYKKDEKGRYIMSTSDRQKALAENPEIMN